MKIVIDTNAIHKDYLFTGAAIRALSTAHERLGFDLLLPAVVYAEHLKDFRDARRETAVTMNERERAL